MLGGGKLHLELDNDRFAADVPLLLSADLRDIRFVLESDNQAEHVARLRLSGLSTGQYIVSHGGEQVASLDVDEEKLTFGRSVAVEISVPAGGRSRPIVVARGDIRDNERSDDK